MHNKTGARDGQGVLKAAETSTGRGLLAGGVAELSVDKRMVWQKQGYTGFK